MSSAGVTGSAGELALSTIVTSFGHPLALTLGWFALTLASEAADLTDSPERMNASSAAGPVFRAFRAQPPQLLPVAILLASAAEAADEKSKAKDAGAESPSPAGPAQGEKDAGATGATGGTEGASGQAEQAAPPQSQGQGKGAPPSESLPQSPETPGGQDASSKMPITPSPNGLSEAAAKFGGSVTLRWNASPASEGVVAYTVYYGTSSHKYTNHVSVGNATSATISHLRGGTYYFAITSTNAKGVESAPSSEFSKIVNALSVFPEAGAQPSAGEEPDRGVRGNAPKLERPDELAVAPSQEQTPIEGTAVPPGFGTRGLRWAETGLLNAPTGPAQGFDSPLNDDPLIRAARVQAASNAELRLDGLNGIPAPYGFGFDNAQVPQGARAYRIGPLTIRGALNVSGSYSEGGGQQGTAGNSTNSNGNGFGLGDGASFDFVLGEPATGHFLAGAYSLSYPYPRRAGDPFVDQALSMQGTLDFAKLRLGLGVSFDALSGMSRDIAGNADRELLGLGLTASYPIGAKTSVNWDFGLPIREVSGGIGSIGFTSTNSVSHQFDSKVSLGLGFTYGVERDNASNNLSLGNDLLQNGIEPNSPPLSPSARSAAERTQTYEDIFVHLGFRPSPLFSLGGSIGVDIRDTGFGRTMISPTINLSASWLPRQGTSVSLGAVQSVQSSETVGSSNYLSTSFQLGLTQRLGSRLSVNVSFGYEHADYSSSLGLMDQRTDNLFTAQISFGVPLSRRWSASFAYIYSTNLSTLAADTFSSSQVQLQTSLAF